MTKKKHHFIPASHLALFTQEGTKDGTLWVFDQANGKQWDTIPEKIGFQKHLYRVDLPDTEPDVIEDIFAEIENNTAPIIKEICTTRKIPEGVEEYSWIINYIALLALRTPTMIENLARPILEVSKIVSQMMLATPEHFNSIKQRMKADGESENNNATYEELRDFVYSENYSLHLDNNSRIQNVINLMDAIIPPLGNRNWTVVYSPPEIGDFIISDNPVSLHWIKPKDRGIWSSPGHALPETEVSVPLSSRIMLLGQFEEIPTNIIISSKRDLAILNSYTGKNSDRFIFSREKDFLWYKQDDTVGNVADFKQLIFEKNQSD